MDASAKSGLVGDRIVGDSQFISQLKSCIGRIAPTDANVLITGETGTGKELVASMLHANSRRRDRPFVRINCAAIPDDLLESELFGYVPGAFTGAAGLKEGKLQLADSGTVFFNEVGDMTLSAQAKILRAIESRQVERLGSNHSLHLDVRVLASTNLRLEELVAEGRFRKDLYFRLNVARIHLPPLRERKADIPSLLEHFLDEFQDQAALGRPVLEPEVWDCIERYDWPGNVRELRNFAEALCATAPAKVISCADLPDSFRTQLLSRTRGDSEERKLLLTVLGSYNWNKTKAAHALKWSRMTLYRKLAKHRIGPHAA